MKNAQPIFDSATHYRIEVQGRVDAGWLQTFDSSAEIIVSESGRVEDTTILDVHADQAGIVGLVRRLHGMGMTILNLQIVAEGERAAGVDK